MGFCHEITVHHVGMACRSTLWGRVEYDGTTVMRGIKTMETRKRNPYLWVGGTEVTALLPCALLIGVALVSGAPLLAQGEGAPPEDPPPFEDPLDQGFDDQGFDDQGFDDQGFDDQGFDDQGFDDQGFDDQGFDDQGFDDQGTGDDGTDRPARDGGGFDVGSIDGFGDEQDGAGQDDFGQEDFSQDDFGRDSGQGDDTGDQIALPLSDLAIRDVRSELIVAIETRDHAGARAVLERGEDIGLDEGRPSGLATAALLGDRTMVLLLLRFGSDPAATTDSPLLEAVRSDEAEIVEILLRAGAEVPGQSSHEELFGGALRGANRVAIYDHLLAAGGDPAICLQVAVDARRPDLAERCLAAGADLAALRDPAALITLYPQDERRRLLELASAGGTSGSDRQVLLSRLLTVAAQAGDLALVDVVMAEGGEPSLGDLALALASGHETMVFELATRLGREGGELATAAEAAGHSELATLLRDRQRNQWLGLAVSVATWVAPAILLLFVGLSLAGRQRRSPKRLHQAVDAGDERAVARLLGAGSDPERRREGLTALHRAVLQGNPRMVSALLRRGADGAARTDDGRGYTAFHLAAEMGSLEIVQLLMRVGIQVEVRAADGETPLFVAAVAGQQAMFEWLIAQGADVEKTMGRGPLLCHAVLAKSLVGVRLLLSIGANPNPEGARQPLLLAVLGGQTEIARVLLAAGADTSIRDATGRGLFEIAQQHQQNEIAQLLQTAAR